MPHAGMEGCRWEEEQGGEKLVHMEVDEGKMHEEVGSGRKQASRGGEKKRTRQGEMVKGMGEGRERQEEGSKLHRCYNRQVLCL